MRKILLATAAVCLAATPAMAQNSCEDAMVLADERLQGAQQDVRSSLTTETRRELRNLRDAANSMAVRGNEEGCLQIVDSIDGIIDEIEVGDIEVQEYVKDGEESPKEPFEAQLSKAQPVADMAGRLNTADVVGTDVYNYNGEYIGEVTNLVIDQRSGNIRYGLLSHGGFLDIGDKEVAVPWGLYSMTADHDAFVLPYSEEQLAKAPDVDPQDRGWMLDEEWEVQNDKYFSDLIHQPQKRGS